VSGTTVVLTECFAAKSLKEFQAELCSETLSHAKKLNDLVLKRQEARDAADNRLALQTEASNNNTVGIFAQQLTVGPIILAVVIAVVLSGIS